MNPIVNVGHTRRLMALLSMALMLACGAFGALLAQQRVATPDRTATAKAALPQLAGTLSVRRLTQPVEVLRDTWGVPHIFAKNTKDLFFAQGFTVAQDRMWQLEMWRRNGEGRLAEVLGPDYVTRDTFARLLAFRGNWDEEFKK
jgi:acyl-homoserine lactone acylase PvdQ